LSEDSRNNQVTVFASEIYKAKGFKRFFLGELYRDAWEAPVTVPVIDLENTAGGLTPLMLGGGRQTTSLRLLGGNGKEYVFRFIQKDTYQIVPEEIRRTFLADIVQDQVAASHPYGAFVIPKLADAAGVYHTNPRLVYVPNSPRLGEFRDVFGGTLVLFEERPDEDQSDMASFGNSQNVVGYERLYEQVYEDNDNEVAEQSLARARLFDMWLGDWDRHDDQFRWAEYDKRDKGELYKPVPRDRDQVFFKFRGVVPSMANDRWFFWELQSFESEIRNLKGLNLMARFLDRVHLTELSMEEWISIAEDMKSRLTDEVIESAVGEWPDTVFDAGGEEIIYKLKSRRDSLPDYATRYYLILAKEVDVVGSDKHELFDVERLENGDTSVVVYKIKKDGNIIRELYRRVFKRSETKEIRLYGLEGKDIYRISGVTGKGTLVRVIGGEDEDVIIDRSKVRGLKKHTVIYDTETGNAIERGNETRDRTSDSDPKVNRYDNEYYRNIFQEEELQPILFIGKHIHYDYISPLFSFGYNSDDGVFLGGGILYKKHGFRKLPYASSHKISGTWAATTNAYSFEYRGHFIGEENKWGLKLDADVNLPNYIINFFGLGNETPLLTDDEDFNRVRLNRVSLFPELEREFSEDHTISIGPLYQFTEAEKTPDRFAVDPRSGLTDTDFDPNHFLGVRLIYNFLHLDNQIVPTKGWNFIFSSSYNHQLNKAGDNYLWLGSELSFYVPLPFPFQTVFAARVGGAYNFGDFEFFQANTLGGTENLRGHRKDRFAGRSSVYQNNEIRIRIFNVQRYLLTGQIGILGLFDQGRVWEDGEDSDKWHLGYGGGIWLSPFNALTVTGTVSHSEEDTLVNITWGFFF
jgi:hypothetical protein